MYGLWILIILFFLLLIAVPWWPYSRGWGYWPGGILVAVLVGWLILIWWGAVTFYWPWGFGPAVAPATDIVPRGAAPASPDRSPGPGPGPRTAPPPAPSR